ncbi:gliding motility-associated C-terminal domain-containing protein [Pedobacter rhizosphaerae]|uniref:Gliding motility-associated C-terminal domain-containing protein n=1 Tax=Pedobacter rhizosphaerae TaxID=390241 RepID=A0A1H9RQJ5_9SPHI|nr:gliding motility-associated C-terminal domain-containing protein [Pedobacter rhizosphaerae]
MLKTALSFICVFLISFIASFSAAFYKKNSYHSVPPYPVQDFSSLHQSKLKYACTATLTGNECVGSELLVTSNSAIAGISWLLDDVSILEQSNVKQNNGIIVAGGNGSGSAPNQLYNPNRIFVDKAGNIFIPDMANNRVQKWAPGATVGITVAGGNGTGNSSNQFNRPTAVAVDGLGNLYVVDQSNSRVQKFSPGATSGITIASSLILPTGICIDAQNNVYVSEQNGQLVRKYSAGTGPGIIVAGGNGYGSAANQLAAPTGLFIQDNNLYICDTDNYRVQKWIIGANTGTTVARTSGNPLGVYVDGSKNIYVSDYTGYAVLKWLPGANSGSIIAGGNGQGNAPNQIMPTGIGMDAFNNLYVSDFLNGRIIKFSNIFTGTYTTLKAGTYRAKITTTDGCTTISNPITVSENLLPKITISADRDVLCDHFQPIFTAVTVNGGANPVLQWQINGRNIPGENNDTFSPNNLTSTDVVTCNLTSSETCVTSRLVPSNSISLSSQVTEAPGVTIQTDQSTTCKGALIKFKATATRAGEKPIYKWKINGNDVGIDSDILELDDLEDKDQVSCTVVSNAQNCQVSTTAESNAIIVRINPILTPTVSIESDISKIYSSSTVNFTATTTNEGTNPEYQWFVNGIPTGANSRFFSKNNLQQGDQVTCELTVTTPCSSTNSVSSNTIDINITIVVKIKPANAFSPNGDGVNDLWQIADLKSFSNCQVSIFNRYGNLVFFSKGYEHPWAGNYQGNTCPPGVYYYVINLDGQQTLTGSLSIIK